VAAKADELFKRLSSAEQKLLQRIFLRIVRPSAESTLDTRRRAAFTELPPEGKELVGKLTDERLLVTNQSASGLEQTVEVAHEALISNWSTLRAWVNEDREFLLWRDRLGPLLKEWERAQQTDEAVLRGPLLIEAQKWFDERSQDLSDQERKFISAGREQRERLAREEKERQQCKLAEAEERRQGQAAAAKSLRRLAGVLVVVAIIAVGGAIFGFWQKNEAEIRKVLRRLRTRRPSGRKQSLRRMLTKRKFRGMQPRSRPGLLSPNNRWVVTGSWDNTARLWDLSAEDPTASPVVLRGHDGAINAVAISPDNRWVVTGSNDNTARLWDLNAKDPAANPIVLRGHHGGVTAVAISPDNRWVVTGSADKTARLWLLQINDLVDLARITAGPKFFP